MAFGFGSEIVDTLLYTELTGLAAMTGIRVIGRPIAVQGDTLPVMAFYPEASSYSPPAFNGDTIGMEVLRYVVKGMCAGTSTDPIRDAVLAQRNHLIANGPTGTGFDVIHDSQHYTVTFEAQGAVPLTTITANGADIYRQLGTVYSVHVTLGG